MSDALIQDEYDRLAREFFSATRPAEFGMEVRALAALLRRVAGAPPAGPQVVGSAADYRAAARAVLDSDRAKHGRASNSELHCARMLLEAAGVIGVYENRKPEPCPFCGARRPTPR